MLVDPLARAFEERRHIEKIIRFSGARLLSELAQIRVQSKHVPAQQTCQQHDPGAGKTEWKIVKNAVLPSAALHELIESARRARQHVCDISRGQNDALGFT